VRRRIRGALARESRDTSGQLQLTLANQVLIMPLPFAVRRTSFVQIASD